MPTSSPLVDNLQWHQWWQSWHHDDFRFLYFLKMWLVLSKTCWSNNLYMSETQHRNASFHWLSLFPERSLLHMLNCFQEKKYIFAFFLSLVDHEIVDKFGITPQERQGPSNQGIINHGIYLTISLAIFLPQLRKVYALTGHWTDQNGKNSVNNIFMYIFWRKKNFAFWLKLHLNSPVDKYASIAWGMAWHWTGDKPLSEPMLTHFTEVCIIRPQY